MHTALPSETQSPQRTPSLIPPTYTATPTISNPASHRFYTFRNSDAHAKQTLIPDNLFLGTGSVEAIDALIQAFCTPGKDSILICPPIYAIYSVSAQVNDIAVLKVPLLSPPTFALNLAAILHTLSITPSIKLLYLISLGNSIGSLLSKSDILQVISHPTWNSILVLDEAYIDFASHDESALLAGLITEVPNLVVLHTLSKAFGLAGIRLGSPTNCSPSERPQSTLEHPRSQSRTCQPRPQRAGYCGDAPKSRTHGSASGETAEGTVVDLRNRPGAEWNGQYLSHVRDFK